jgi:kynurenine formamidase
VSLKAVPPPDEVRGWLRSLSNWGRWGPDDELGTLNHLGPSERSAALRLATGDATISLAFPITYERPPHGAVGEEAARPHPSWSVPMRFSVQDGDAAPDPGARFAAYDAFLIAPHGPLVTHLDAPLHTIIEGTAYNGLPPSRHGEVAARGTITAVRDGIVGRGVLLDIPADTGRPWLDDGEAILPDDLERSEARAGVRVGRGDVLFVRTGYRRRLPGGPPVRHAPRPGLQAACLPWLREREVAVVGSDVPIDVFPHGYDDLGLPIHAVGMWAMGLWLLDNCALEHLAEHCARIERWQFLAMLGPLVLSEGTGSPINPIAVM